MSLLILENIHKEYNNKPVLKGATLKLDRGERLALVGPNGAGKSTLLKMVVGMEKPDTGSIALARNTRIGYLSQTMADFGMVSDENNLNCKSNMADDIGQSGTETDIETVNKIETNVDKLVNKNPEHITALHYEEVARLEKRLRELETIMGGDFEPQTLQEYDDLLAQFERLGGYSIEANMKMILAGLGLKPEVFELPLSKLSGGEKMRVAMAKILISEPDLLILDEPTNHLDVVGTEWLESFLRSFGGGVVLVSHDRYFMDQVITRVAELDNGTIYDNNGNYSEFMFQKEIRREFALKEKQRLERESLRAKEAAVTLRSHRNISAWKSRLKVVEKLDDALEAHRENAFDKGHLNNKRAPGVAFSGAKHLSNEILQAKNLGKNFGDMMLFKGADFLIKGGDKVGIIGSNGCGKTTLLNILLGRDKDFTGTARIGNWVKYGYLGQSVSFDNESDSIVAEIMKKGGLSEASAREYAARFLFTGDDVYKPLKVLSGGERVRVWLAGLILGNPDCLIMDEPTNHLDVASRNAVEAALLKFNGTIIAVSHDRYFLNRCVNRIFEIENEQINQYEGNYDYYRKVREGSRLTASCHSGGISPEMIRKNNVSPLQQERMKQKEQAVLEKEINRIEAEIVRLEKQADELQASFGPETPAAEYVKFDGLVAGIALKYQEWEKCMRDRY